MTLKNLTFFSASSNEIESAFGVHNHSHVIKNVLLCTQINNLFLQNKIPQSTIYIL